MDLVFKIDKIILAGYTKLSHKFQDLTGRTNFFLAKIAIWGVIIASLVICFNFYFRVLVRETDWASLIINILLALIYSLFLIKCTNAEKDALNNSERKMHFPNGVVQQIARLILVFLAATFIPKDIYCLYKSEYIIFELLYTIGYYSMVSFTYLVIVTPKPPSKSKIKKWIESFSKPKVVMNNV